MLMKPDKNKMIASIIDTKPVEEGPEMSKDEGLETMAMELMAAIDSKDAKQVAQIMKSMVYACEESDEAPEAE